MDLFPARWHPTATRSTTSCKWKSQQPEIAVHAHLIGIIEGEQIDGKKTNRNDRLVAVAEVNHEYAGIRRLKDLPKKFLRELEEFFVNYHRLEGKKYKLLGCKNTDAAMRMIRKAQRAA